MASQEYFIRFGSGDPRTLSGLSPSFIVFRNYLGSNIAAPVVSEVGSTSGIYKFTYDATQSIAFIADGATAGLGNNDRYVVGALGLADSLNNNVLGVSQSVANLGSSFVAFSTSFGVFQAAIGSTASSFGDSSTDPSTVFGFLRRSIELLEGSQTFTKSSGVLALSSRNASVALRSLTVTDSSVETKKI